MKTAIIVLNYNDYKIVVKEGNSGAEEAASADETEEAAETKTSGLLYPPKHKAIKSSAWHSSPVLLSYQIRGTVGSV